MAVRQMVVIGRITTPQQIKQMEFELNSGKRFIPWQGYLRCSTSSCRRDTGFGATLDSNR